MAFTGSYPLPPETLDPAVYASLHPLAVLHTGGPAAFSNMTGINDTAHYGLDVLNSGVGTGGGRIRGASGGALRVKDGTVEIDGGLTITNVGGGGLNVNGATNLLGVLNVTGLTTVTTLKATGAVDFDSTLNVDGATTTAAITASGVITANNTLVANAAFIANGDSTLGNAAGDALAVNATSSFLSPVTVTSTFATESTTTLGNAAGDVITVNGTSTFTAGATLSTTLDVDGAATFDSAVTLGNAAGDAITVTGTATFAQTPLFQAQIDVQGGTAGSIRVGAVIVGAAALDGSEELLVNGQSRLKGAVEVTTGGILLDAAPSTPTANVGYRESFAKGWVKFNTSGTILAELNISSITDTGAGNWTVNWDRDFSSSDYAVVATAQATWTGADSTTFNAQIHDATVTGAATQILVMRVSDGALTDPTAVHVIAFGTQ